MSLKFLSNSFGAVKLFIIMRYLILLTLFTPLAYTVIYYYTVFNIFDVIYSTGLQLFIIIRYLIFLTLFTPLAYTIIYSIGLHAIYSTGLHSYLLHWLTQLFTPLAYHKFISFATV